MEEIICETNARGIRVRKSCMACRWKELTRASGMRLCTKTGKGVRPTSTCKDWEMSETMRLAGWSQGVIRDKDTKEVVIR